MGDEPPTVADDTARGGASVIEPMPVAREKRLRVDRVSPKRTRLLVAYHQGLARFNRRINVVGLLSWLAPGVLISVYSAFVTPGRGQLPYAYPHLMLPIVVLLALPMLITVIVASSWPNRLRYSMRVEASRHDFKLCGTCLRDLRGEPRVGHCRGCGAFYGFAVLEAAWRELYHDAANKFPEEHVVVEPAVPCRSCGYDLRGLGAEGRCPECGAEFGDDAAAGV